MPIGDSITQGCCSDLSVAGAYRNGLYQLLTDAGYNVDFVGTETDAVNENPDLPDRDHQGVPGILIQEVSDSIAGSLKAIEDPDVILLHMGTTNFWIDEDLETVKSRITALIGQLAVLRPHAKIIVSSLIPRADSREATQQAYNNSLVGIVNDQVALGRQVSFVDLHAALDLSDLNDAVHPKATGFSKMADGWNTAISNVISPYGTDDPPKIANASAQGSLQEVTVRFSKPVKSEDVIPANFQLSGGVNVLAASLDPDSKRIVKLTTTVQSTGTNYTLAVSGIRDLTPEENTIASGETWTFASLAAADASLIFNGGFEEGAPVDYGVLDGWAVTGNPVPLGYSSTPVAFVPPFTPFQGSRMAVFSNGSNVFNGSISQTFATTPGQVYALKLNMGIVTDTAGRKQRLQVLIDGSALGTAAEEITSPGAYSYWEERSFTFTATGLTTTLTLSDASGSLPSNLSKNSDMLLDNVRVTEAATLTVKASPAIAVNVGVSPPDLDGDGSGETVFTRNYEQGESVTLTAPASSAAYLFVEWRENGVLLSSDPAVTVTMSGNSELTAVYELSAIPVAVTDAYATYENTPLVVSAAQGLLANDSDPNALPLTVTLVSGTAQGILVLNTDGSFNYDPAVDSTGTAVFSYYATNGTASSEAVTVTITINPVGPFANGGFEQGMPVDYGILEGWTVAGDPAPLGYSSTPVGFVPPFTPFQGSRMAVFSSGSNVFNGSISQTFATTPGQDYALKLNMGIVTDTAGRKQRLQVLIDGSALGTAAEEITSPGAYSYWEERSFTFTATGLTTTLTLSDASGSLPSNLSKNSDMLLDNVRVDVAPPNSAPVFTTDPVIGAAATQDLLYSGSIATAATDADAGDTLVYSLQGTPTWLTVAADGTLAGTPGLSHVGPNSFTVRVTDAAGAFDEAVLAITVNANSAPVFTTDPVIGAAATQDLLYSGSIATAATDADAGDTLVYSLQGTPTWLTVAADGTLAGTPGLSHVGPNSFTVRVTDAAGAFDEAVLAITVNANSAPVFTTDPVIGAAATQDLLYSGSIATAATDADAGDTLVYSLQGTPTWLTVAADGTLAGTPGLSHVGPNSFTVRVTDAAGAFDEAVLAITVNANSAPVFTTDPVIGAAATQDLLYSGSIATAATDADAGDTLVYSLQGTPTWLTVAADGTLAGTPGLSHVGPNSFTVRVTDAAGAFDEAVLAITVNANSAPVFTTDPVIGAAATHDLLYSGSIATAATDADAGDTLVYSLQGTPTWLTVAADGTLAGTPGLSHVGPNSFTVRVTDAAGAFDEAVLAITVNANSAPVFTTDPVIGAAATQDLLYSGSIATAATDADAGDTLVYSLQGTPTWLTVAADGTLAGTPGLSHVGPNSFTVRVTDAAGAFDEAVLAITVNANSAPVFTTDPVIGAAATQDLLYSGSIATAATDADAGDTLVYSLQGTPTWLTVAADGTLAGTPGLSHVGPNSFTVRVTDAAGAFDEAVLAITVNANSAPVFTTDPVIGAAATQDLLYSGSIATAATDADAGDTLVYSLQGTPTWLTVAADGTLAGTPGLSHVGPNSFTVRVTDAAGAFDEAVLAITVNANSAPVFTTDPVIGAAATQDLLYSGSIATAATDADAGDTLVYSLQGTPTWLTVAADGTLAGTPGLSHVGPNSFTVRVTDAAGAFDEAVLAITVNANSAPVFTTDPVIGAAATQDLLYSGSIATAATDADAGDTLVYSLQGTPTWLTVAADGTLAGTPGLSHVGPNSFTVRVTDAAGAFDEAVLAITVNANSAPVFTTDPVIGAAATQDLLYSGSIATAATDADAGDTLVYSLQGTPTWLTVAADGTLAGTPGLSHVGPNSFTVRVTDAAGAFDEAVLAINVLKEEFTQWMDGYDLTDGPGVDSDGDSISNAVEYVIGGNPANEQDTDLLPTVDMTTAGYLTFTYRRTDLANTDSDTTITVEWGTTLTNPWTAADGTHGEVIEVEDVEGKDYDLVKVRIPSSLAPNGKLFARLGVLISQP